MIPSSPEFNSDDFSFFGTSIPRSRRGDSMWSSLQWRPMMIMMIETRYKSSSSSSSSYHHHHHHILLLLLLLLLIIIIIIIIIIIFDFNWWWWWWWMMDDDDDEDDDFAAGSCTAPSLIFLKCHQFPINLIIGLYRLPEVRSKVQKKENHQNLTPEMMGKSNQVHLIRFGNTRALK